MGGRNLMVNDSKDDEEISIDFGKIKNFFKKDKKEEKEPISEKNDEAEVDIESKGEEIKVDVKGRRDNDLHIGIKEGDEEVSIDFGRVKSFFKSDEGEERKKHEIGRAHV